MSKEDAIEVEAFAGVRLSESEAGSPQPKS
jgi:hypothetical protein